MLLAGLAQLGLGEEDVDQVVLSHLHFDHAGGLLPPHGEPPRLLFPRARYATGRAHWERATTPHSRDRASFIPELNSLLEESGRLILVEGERHQELGAALRFHWCDGHTPGLMLTEVRGPRDRLVFLADLVPGMPWVHLPITMGYDRWPERLIDEKAALWQRWEADGIEAGRGWLAFTHDPDVALARLGRDERGRYRGEEGLTDEAVRGLEL